MNKWLQLCLTISLIVFSPLNLAQDTESENFKLSEPIVENENDLAVQIFRGILGDVVNLITGEDLPTAPDTILGKVMFMWCGTLFSVACLFVAFAGFKWFFGAIHSGKVNDRKMDATGVPIRMVVALISTMPLAAGYCFYQLVHVYLSGQSINAANALHQKITQNMSADAFKHATIHVPSEEVTAKAFETMLCAHGLNAVEGLDSGETIISPGYIEELAEGDADTHRIGIKYGDQMDHWFDWGGYENDICGTYLFEFDEPSFRMTTDGSAENILLQSSYNAIIDLLNTVSSPASKLVNETFAPSGPHSLSEELASTLQSELKDAAATYKSAIDTAHQLYGSAKTREMNLPDNELPAYIRSTPSFLENYSLDDIGFTSLGATWWIDSIRTQAFTSMIKSADVAVEPIKGEALSHPDLDKLWLYSNKITNGKSGTMSIVGEGADQKISHKTEAQLSFMIKTSQAIVKESDDPLFALMELGHEMITTAEVLAALALSANIGLEVINNIDSATNEDLLFDVPIIGTKLRIAKATIAGIAEGGLRSIASVLGILMLLCFTMGIYMAYYLPSIPLMHWLGGVIGAFSANLEQIILAPVHGLAHAFTDGQGFIGERAKQGYILAFGAWLRFPMLVISFIVVYPLLLMMGKLTFLLWLPFAESMSSTTTTGLVGFFGMTAALVAICVSVIERVFSIMHEINDKALRAFGHGADSMGAQGFVHSGNQQFSTVQSNVSQMPGAMSSGEPDPGSHDASGESSNQQRNKDLNL